MDHGAEQSRDSRDRDDQGDRIAVCRGQLEHGGERDDKGKRVY